MLWKHALINITSQGKKACHIESPDCDIRCGPDRSIINRPIVISQPRVS